MMIEAQDIFGLDFDPAEFDQVARDGVISDEEEQEEEVRRQSWAALGGGLGVVSLVLSH